MGASDGYVGSTTKVVDHGSNATRWNLVIMGDGYQAGELAQYHTDVEHFLDRMRATPPFDDLWCGINVHRVDVVSNESGADDPTDCGGDGSTPNTYFDATFCSSWGGTLLERLLTIDQTLALTTAATAVPEVHQALVLVNHSKYGGAGGTVASASTNAQSAEIAIHEIGHSAFGLADEYEGTQAAPAVDPPEPNVTIDADRATIKWGDLIDPATPMPSSCYGDCPTCTPPATPPPPGAVGAYEGGKYVHCGVFRPLPNCYMRDYQPFCPVCDRVIRQTLAPYLPPESINLITPSIDFLDVPEGMGGAGITTYRAIVWDVVTCRDLTFRIAAGGGPTGGFGTPFGTEAPYTPDGIVPVGKARLWLSYTSTTAPDTAGGQVTVECVETGQSWLINIDGNTIPRPKSAVALVLDRSGSMDQDAGDNTRKVDKLREAAGIFVDVMLPGDGVGIVTFDDQIDRLMNITDVGAEGTGPGRMAAIGHIGGAALDPRGATSIGGGVVEGKATLDDGQTAAGANPYDVLAQVVLSDGVENTAPMLSTVGSSITSRTFAVGLGLPSNISISALTELCQGNDGYLLITGELDTEQSRLLNKYFLQILAGVSNAEVAVDPGGQLRVGVEHRIPFDISETDYGMDVLLLSPFARVIDFHLETPSGDRITPGDTLSVPGIRHILRKEVAYYRASLPVLPKRPERTHEGTWCAVLTTEIEPKELLEKLDDRDVIRLRRYLERGVYPYDLLVHTYSNLVFDAAVTQTDFEPGAVIDLTASLSEYDVAVDGRARVFAELSRPDGTGSMVPFDEVEPGRFRSTVVTDVAGLYTARVRAEGETFHGRRFTRERTLTFAVRVGGNRPSTGPATSAVCELIECLDRSGFFGSELAKRWREAGFDPADLAKCLARNCQPVSKPG